MRIDYNSALRNPMIPDAPVTRRGTIATVTLHNPGRLNALTESDAAWLVTLSADEGVGCVVLRERG